ncbi:MAG: glycosyltransferase [Bacteroidota bacterium]
MTLSVIIVSYNVKKHLEQCLYSVQKASSGIETEIYVVDNNSVDGSVELIKNSFPKINLIANKDNKGFATACNQALALTKSKYALLLNPDTVVAENSFSSCIQFMENHSDAGALGVKMINGKGRFLPESKRSLPTPWISFYKIFGLSALFPNSKTFGKYQLKYIDENEIAEVEVLSGAFMFLRMKTIQKTGFLDEQFFMYGEDIDLSYRIVKSGYKNYYYPKTTIIHYKGESTKKGSLNYVRIFYQAMSIFAKKHFSNKNLRWFLIFIQLAIYLRAGISILKRLFNRILLPILDFVLIFFIFRIILPTWSNYKFGDPDYYPTEFINIFIPAYIFIWLFFVFIKGGYRKFIFSIKIFYSILYGSIAVLIFYSLLPESYRFSRALILIGPIITFVGLFITRIITSLFKVNIIDFMSKTRQKTAIIYEASDNENKLFETFENKFNIIGYLSKKPNHRENYLGDISRLSEIIDFYKISRVIYFLNDISFTEIINSMLTVDKNIDFKLVLPTKNITEDDYIIIDVGEHPEIKSKLTNQTENKLRNKLFSIFISFKKLINNS